MLLGLTLKISGRIQATFGGPKVGVIQILLPLVGILKQEITISLFTELKTVVMENKKLNFKLMKMEIGMLLRI